MASTMTAQQSFPATASPRKRPFLCPELIFQKHISTSAPIMDTLYRVIERGNKVDIRTVYKDMWKFYIEDVNEVVGFIRDDVQKQMDWGPRFLHVQDKGDWGGFDMREITLMTSIPRFEGGKYPPAEACQNTFMQLFAENRNHFPGMDRWLNKDESVRETSPIHLSDPGMGLSIPLPVRGLLGVVTVGVHLNVYKVKREGGKDMVDRIWVSHRASGSDFSYPGMLDQIVAGGVDCRDEIDGRLAPCKTLIREAEEEAGFTVDFKSRQVFCSDQAGNPMLIGSVERVSDITFYDCKDSSAGDIDKNHLEPGLRIVYDLKITEPRFNPQGREPGIERFEAMSVPQVKESLRADRWKPNCGLVMLDFMVRHGIVTRANDSRFNDIKKDLHRPLPFKFISEYEKIIKGW
ncbi:thiamine pyrophosphokinase [Fusarium heterosporum]|uniref:Thiamine pyrophosphokinase n=1 Tax=Fusarium heterosporum TaxID=42747 RepID=A0A8H5WCM6_FUSHE|nr:thiamine pyrophosphokinase [Fusarium heterosporum]